MSRPRSSRIRPVVCFGQTQPSVAARRKLEAIEQLLWRQPLHLQTMHHLIIRAFLPLGTTTTLWGGVQPGSQLEASPQPFPLPGNPPPPIYRLELPQAQSGKARAGGSPSWLVKSVAFSASGGRNLPRGAGSEEKPIRKDDIRSDFLGGRECRCGPVDGRANWIRPHLPRLPCALCLPMAAFDRPVKAWPDQAI